MSAIITILMFLWDSFRLWIHNLFLTPFQNLEVLWILVPVYLGLLVAELYQEKKGTSMGNAMSNSIIVLWGGVDFLRITINSLDKFDLHFFSKLLISAIILVYGITILIIGFKAKEVIRYIGRIREVCYCIIIFAPLYYANVQLSWSYLFGAVFYFPLFYLAVHIIDKFVPDPQALVRDINGSPSKSYEDKMLTSKGL